METIWAPWRLAYIEQDAPAPQPKPESGCFLCSYRDQPEEDARNLVLHRGKHAFIVFNRYPYNNGHLLIAPQGHLGDLTEIPAETQAECQELLVRMVELLRQTIQPDGFNIGLNLGRVAGAGLPGHLHWHIVPRWNGDTNFMPVLAQTKVIPQSLEALYQKLSQEMNS
ncbi:MAG: HIT domain-containing protein [Planctomycetaceae bacterium]|nr:HIT domain-containing protein [Planctomycetaceae bacterium]